MTAVKIKEIPSFLKKNTLYYFISCMIVSALNYLYRSGDSSLLTWILAPTAWWAGILGSLSFEPLPGMGYVNEAHRFLIAPSCSGVRFLQTVFLMLVFSSTHRIAAGRRKLFWIPFCLGFSYLAAVLINGLRIVLSIRLPLWLEQAYLLPAALSAEKLHTLIGTTVYFSGLLLIWPFTCTLTAELFSAADVPSSSAKPAFWYLLAVLGLPFLHRLATGNLQGFGQYALIIVLPCCCILLLTRFLKK